jgi:hypothetical protein
VRRICLIARQLSWDKELADGSPRRKPDEFRGAVQHRSPTVPIARGSETGFGTHITAGQFNAFNVLYHGLNFPFVSFQLAINSVGHSLTNSRNGYDFTNTATLYGHYCSGAGCSAGLKNVNTFMNQQGGNTNSLHYPCKKE